MDVDLLRPGTVPMSKDTILWFEFLLNPALLEKHLSNPNGDPTPTDLMMKLLMMSAVEQKCGVDPEPPVINGGKIKQSHRSLALKIIALKVFAFLKWDLDILEEKLPVELQSMLLKDLLSLLDDEYTDPTCHSNLDLKSLSPEVAFSLILYHRWVLRAYVKASINSKLAKLNPPQIVEVEVNDNSPTEAESEVSAALLQKVAALSCLPFAYMPECRALVPLSENITEVKHRWDFVQPVNSHDYRCQILMDVGMYGMFREMYMVSRTAIKECKVSYSWIHEWWNPDGGYTFYSKVSSQLLTGMCLALDVKTVPHLPTPPSPSLTLQFLSAITNLDVGRLLEKDNVENEIPMMYRDCFELDLESEVASGKVTAQRDAIQIIQAANLVRRAIHGSPWHKVKLPPHALDKAIMSVADKLSEAEKRKIGLFLLELLATQDMAFARELADTDSRRLLITEEECLAAQESDYSDPLPSVLLDPEIPVPKNASTVLTSLERQLISSYDPHEIKAAIVKLWQGNSQLEIEKINKNWEVPIPLYNIIMGLPNGITQNYIYVLLCKAYQLDKMKSYSLAKTLLRVIVDEIGQEFGNQVKLTQLVHWEILLLDIHQFHNDWPAKHMDWGMLGDGCTCVVETDGILLPRVTLREDCCLTLLNIGKWLQLTSAPNNKLLPQTSQLYLTVASVCLDVKFNRKPNLDLWDKVLSVVGSKCRSDGVVQMQESLCRIMDVTALTVVASLLAKLHNILTDQPAADLYLHLIQLWPNTVKNGSHFNVKWVTEILWELVNHAVQLYPNNMAWSKLLGDLHFANGHYASALKCYLEATIAGSDYFARPVNRTILEDHFVKKMIRSCIHLQCHSQAGVLCQLLEEVDYTTAFKSFQETSSWDAMDSYYDCIWDVTILEFLINLHTKRNEHYRKQRAILMMGLLELNSNNNEEIKREAENIRKSKFLRSMAKQYIC